VTTLMAVPGIPGGSIPSYPAPLSPPTYERMVNDTTQFVSV